MRRFCLATALLGALTPALARGQGVGAPPMDEPPRILLAPTTTPLAPPPPNAPPPLMPQPSGPELYVPPSYPDPGVEAVTAIAPPPPPGLGVIKLHLESPSAMMLKRDSGPPVTVYDLKGEHLSAGVICVTPCDVVVDARQGTSFVLGGGFGIPDSSSFSLSDQAGSVAIRVDPGSTVLRGAAVGLIGLSGLSLYVGAVLAAAQDSTSPSNSGFNTGDGILIAGVVFAVGAGIAYFLSRTSYEISPQPAAPKAP